MSEYQSPIKVLYTAIMETFELSSEPMRSILKRAAANGLISTAVYIDPELNPIQTPRADPVKREIQLQGIHLSFLWSYCYLMIGMQELTYDYWNPQIPLSEQILKERIEEIQFIVKWARYLNKMGTVWPERIPEPNTVNDRVVLTNELFLHAVRYLMYHEAAHLILHNDSIELVKRIKSNGVATTYDLRQYRNMELQADDYAYDCLFGDADGQPIRYMKALGALIAHLSSFLLLENTNTKMRGHPDLDTRLKRIVAKQRVTTEPFNTWLHLTITVGLQTFLSEHDTEHITRLAAKGPHETFEELESDLFALLDSLKHKGL